MSDLSRRDFVKTAAAAPMAIGGLGAGKVPDTIRVGLVGCGGRGTGAAENCLESSQNVEIVALADMFEDKVEACAKSLETKGQKIEKSRRFSGFDGYQKLLDSGLDMVILATPPGFRPIHFQAAVDAGKHVFMEKPVAVDPAGVRKVIEAGKKAKEKGLAVVAGTQRRHEKNYLETVKRLHDGAIGDIVTGRCYWNGDRPWFRRKKPGMSDMEYQIHNWYHFCWLSGDHIVEQHIHNLDVMNWVLGAPPVSAVAVGGRSVYTGAEWGDIWDHFAVDFEFPKGVHVMSMCRHWKGVPGNVSEAVVGTKGRANPGGQIEVTGEKAWGAPKGRNPYVQEHADLIESIRKGEPLNEAAQVASSTLTAIMGREAAYTGKKITWDAFMKSDLDLSPKKYEAGPLEVRPTPVPGANR